MSKFQEGQRVRTKVTAGDIPKGTIVVIDDVDISTVTEGHMYWCFRPEDLPQEDPENGPGKWYFDDELSGVRDGSSASFVSIYIILGLMLSITAMYIVVGLNWLHELTLREPILSTIEEGCTCSCCNTVPPERLLIFER